MTNNPLYDIAAERAAQDAKWGAVGTPQRTHPDGTAAYWSGQADRAKQRCTIMAEMGQITWADILSEEFFEALAETEPAALRAELVQVAAVCVAWIESIDLRS